MGDFTPIETQEQLDAVIGERIKRERETSAKKYEGYLSPDDFKSKTVDYEKQIGARNAGYITYAFLDGQAGAVWEAEKRFAEE